MAEHKKLSMLVKLDDGQTYTLGGDGADNAVTLDTEQTITGLKTFDKLPQSSVEPKADADLITKKFADSHYLPVDTKPHKYDILVKMKHDGTSWVGFSDFSVRLRDGTRLDIKHIENQNATTATQPVKAVFKTVKDLNARIEAPTQQAANFFDSYNLEAGEFTGTVSFYLAAGKFGPASYDINPWYVYVGYGNGNNYDGIYAVSIDNLDKPLLGVNFKFGDVHTSATYTCLQCGVVFTVDGSALEVAYDGDMSNSAEATIEYPINAQSMIGFVTVDTEQEITALKTFKVLPQSEVVPADDKDLVNKKYVDEKFGAGGGTGGAAPANMVTTDTAQNITEVKTFDKLPKSSVEPTDDTELVNKKYVDSKAGDGSIKTSLLIKAYPYVVSQPLSVWSAGYQDLKISLEDNKHLVPLYLEATSAKDATEAINVIYKVSDTEYVKGSIQQQAKEWFSTYDLKEGEVKGLIYFANVLNDNLSNNSYSTCVDPFDDYAAGGNYDRNGSLIKFLFVDLPLKIRKFSFKLGATSQKSLPQSIQVFGSSGSERYTSALLESSIDNFYYGQKRTFHISFVNEEYVGLINDQVISGKKFFEVTPKLKNAPVGSNEVATKGYVDGLLNISQKCVVRIKAKNVADQKYISITRPRLYLSNGTVLQATHATDDKRYPTSYAVFKPVPATDKEFPTPEKSTYELMDAMAKNDNTLVFATIKMSYHSDSSIPSDIVCPTAVQLFSPLGSNVNLAGTVSTEVTPITFEFTNLPAPVTSIGLYSHQNGTHVRENTLQYRYEIDFGSKSAVSSVIQTNTMEDYKYSTLEATVANSIIDYTDIKQNITALKTFGVLPQSEATPTDEKDLVTKKFLDAAIAELDRRIKALEDAAPQP